MRVVYKPLFWSKNRVLTTGYPQLVKRPLCQGLTLPRAAPWASGDLKVSKGSGLVIRLQGPLSSCGGCSGLRVCSQRYNLKKRNQPALFGLTGFGGFFVLTQADTNSSDLTTWFVGV